MSSYRELAAGASTIPLNLLETAFEELVGIKEPITQATHAVYRQFGKLFADHLGIGPCSASVAMINLNAFVPYATALPAIKYSKSVNNQLGSLAYIQNNYLLVKEIARTSVILDFNGQSNNIHEFPHNLLPIETKSGYVINNLVGQTNLIQNIENGIQCVVNRLTAAERSDILDITLTALALGTNIGNIDLGALCTKTH